MCFFEPVKKLKLKTFKDISKKVKLKTSTSKVIIKQQGNIAFQLLTKMQEKNTNLDLDTVMSYQLTPVPYSLGSPDGFLKKTNKALGRKMITSEAKDTSQESLGNTVLIVDGNVVYHALVEMPDTFKGVCGKCSR